MMSRRAISLSFLMLLCGCNQNVSTTIYMRDINDLISGGSKNGIPLDVNIDILATGIEKRCSDPEGIAIIEAIKTGFSDVKLVGCEKIQGSMNDKMTVRAVTVLSVYDVNAIDAHRYLIRFDIVNENKSEPLLIAQFSQSKFDELSHRISAINPMLDIKLDSSNIEVILNNDERTEITARLGHGEFVDGVPFDVVKEVKIRPRQQVRLTFGDVKRAFMTKEGWAGFASLVLAP